MEYLQRSLDDTTAAPCGRCDNCAGVWYPADVLDDATASASSALDRVGVPIEPRGQWPTGADRLGVDAKGRIALTERVTEGRALARLTDLGWGNTLRDIFAPSAVDAPASAPLLAACVRVLAEWGWDDRPVGIVIMPSRAHPLLVASIAEHLARVGRLPLLGALELEGSGPRGESGGNSAYRLASVWNGFVVGPDLAGVLAGATGPVLLVDDLADSRWTLTVAGRLLRRAGAPGVLPFALALRS